MSNRSKHFVSTIRRCPMSIRRKGTFQSIFVVLLVPFLCLGLACGKKESAEKEAKAPGTQDAQVVQAYGKLPLSFTENRGQVSEPVRFYISGSRGTIYYTPEEVVYDVVEKTSQPERKRPGEREPELVSPDTTIRRRGVVVRMKFQGANPSVVLEGVDELEGKVNIFRGKDPDKWKTGIRTFGGIVYRDLYSGVDLSYYGQGGRLSQQLTVSPRGNVEDIAFRYEGADRIRVDDEGRLRIETALGTITELKLMCYQEKDGQKVEVEGSYRMIDENTVGFAVRKFKKDLPLIISGG
jgi:hypothetical protein